MDNIMQGDAYCVPFRIRSGGTEITPELVDTVEITIGELTKTYPGEVDYDMGWIVPLSQQDTFRLGPSLQPVQVRIKFITGDVVGASCGCVCVGDSLSKAVL